jgi:bla regulator protein BlaR1
MIAWMVYVIAVSLLLGLAALAAEHSARLRRASTRWYWLAAILASLLLPTVIASVSIQLPHLSGTRAAHEIVVLRDATRIPLPSQVWPGANRAQVQPWHALDPWIKDAWITASSTMLLMLVAIAIQLYRLRRVWAQATMLGTAVHIAPDMGPAVVGFLAPAIVVPVWLTRSAHSEQAAVIAHEKCHLRAGDPQLFTVALCLLVFMPWNLPLWWQVRRLRHAIEVDCDARVLADGHDPVTYGETLIAVGEKRFSNIGVVAAMSESKSLLERRITIMNSKPAPLWKLSAVATGCLSVALVAVAAQVSPPNAQSAADGAAAVNAITLGADVLDRYTGYYRLGKSRQIAVVTRTGGRLFFKLTGVENQEVLATSPTHFVLKLNPALASADFITDGASPATELVTHWGPNISWLRMDAATGRQFEAELAARIQNSTPAPGTEAALRGVLGWEETGTPDYATLAPGIADLIRKTIGEDQKFRAALGAVKSVQFQGVGPNGYDSYLVTFEKGARIYRILLGENGLIDRLSAQPL